MNTQHVSEQLIKKRTANQLIDSILTRIDNVPNFALLLGSGASSTSHVKTAREMINHWHQQLYKRSGEQNSFENWLSNQNWHDSDDEYAILFSFMYVQPPLRRNYIEECLKDAHPTWGYVYLTNFLKNNVFNVVFTTNFDDLINEACFLYSDVRPIICAHDSAVSGIRVTSARPKIIKLHGDFLFDNIKATPGELGSLEGNMEAKFMQFAREYGLVVIGYSGRDDSVMDILARLVPKKGEYFPQGIYWCEREGEEKRTRRLSSLLRKDNVYLVKIVGFDEFMAELNRKAGFDLPAQVADPLWVARDRAHLFVGVPDSIKRNEIISGDISKVLESVSHMMSSKAARRYLGDRLPPSLRAAALRQKKELENALEELEQAYIDAPNDTLIAYDKASVLAKLRRGDELKKLIYARPLGNDPTWDADKTYFLLHASDNEGAIALADEILSSDPKNYIARINRAIALKRLGHRKDLKKELSILEGQRLKEDVCAGIAALRGSKKKMLSLLKKALDKSLITPDEVEMFIVFEDYWGDSDLVNLLAKKGHNGLDKEKGV